MRQTWFWQNLCSGVESITHFSYKELADAGISPEVLDDPHYVKAGGILEGVALFDAAFFGYTPREAAIMDPQQRLFLECAWKALEQAAYDTERYKGRIGVYAGEGLNTYFLANVFSHHLPNRSVVGFQNYLGNATDFLATRTSYKLNLHGPGVVVQSACSTPVRGTQSVSTPIKPVPPVSLARKEPAAPPFLSDEVPATEEELNPLEQHILTIWSSLLGLEAIHAHDDFFVLGGDSLIAGLIAARLTETLHIEVPLRLLFEHSTIAALSKALEPHISEMLESLPDEEDEQADTELL